MNGLLELQKHARSSMGTAFWMGGLAMVLTLVSVVSGFSPNRQARFWLGLVTTAGAVAAARKTEEILEGAISGKELALHTHEAMRRADVRSIYQQFSPSQLMAGMKDSDRPLELPADQDGAAVLTAFDAVTDGRIKLEYRGRLDGPAFIRILVDVRRGTSVKDLPAKAQDLQVKMRLDTPPLIATYREGVGIDIPRRPEDRREVLFKDYEQQRTHSAAESLYMLIGVDIYSKPVEINFADPDTPHLLAAGMTGSGKSEWMRAAIASVVNRYPSDEVKVIIADLKGTKFAEYARCPHLYNPLNPDKPAILTDREDAIASCESLADEMDRRYKLFRENNCENISDWNRKMARKLPRLISFCDEYDDLVIDTDSADRINLAVCRLGKKAREAGIHIGAIISQRPTKENVSTNIKANIPARVALKVANGVESQVVLGDGMTEAKDLLGRGDLLYYTGGELQRLHAAFIPPLERDKYARCPVETRVEEAVDEVMRLSPEEKELRRQQQELERLYHMEGKEPDTPDSGSQVPKFQVPPTSPEMPKKGVDPGFLKFLELRNLRESGMHKTQILEALWGKKGRNFLSYSQEYEELLERYGNLWAVDLIEAGLEDDLIIDTIWLRKNKKSHHEREGRWQPYVERLQNLRRELEGGE